MKSEIFISKNLTDTKKFAEVILDKVQSGNREATVIAFHGNLGAGKTTLVQSIGKILGVRESMQSPTFLLMKRYQTQSEKFSSLVHVDAYRIENESEMDALRFRDVLKEKNTLVCVEWPEKISSFIPLDAWKIDLSFIDETTRQFQIISAS